MEHSKPICPTCKGTSFAFQRIPSAQVIARFTTKLSNIREELASAPSDDILRSKRSQLSRVEKQYSDSLAFKSSDLHGATVSLVFLHHLWNHCWHR